VKFCRYFLSQCSEFAVIILCVASQRVFIVVGVYFLIDSVRKLLDTSSYFAIPFRVEIQSSSSAIPKITFTRSKRCKASWI